MGGDTFEFMFDVIFEISLPFMLKFELDVSLIFASVLVFVLVFDREFGCTENRIFFFGFSSFWSLRSSFEFSVPPILNLFDSNSNEI